MSNVTRKRSRLAARFSSGARPFSGVAPSHVNVRIHRHLSLLLFAAGLMTVYQGTLGAQEAVGPAVQENPQELIQVAGHGALEAGEVPDSALQSRIQERVQGFRGEVGVYVRHLESGAFAAVQADTLFPTASMVKLPLLVSLYDHVERGDLDLDSRLAYDDSLFYGAKGDDDIINTMRPGETATLSKLAFFMISISDNTASLWIQGLVTGEDVNRWLADHGFRATRVNSRVEGRRGDWERYPQGNG